MWSHPVCAIRIFGYYFHTGLWGLKGSAQRLIPVFPVCSLIVLFEFLTPSFLQLLSPSYSEDASFLDWHPTSSFTLNPRNASVLLCVFFSSILQQSLSLPPLLSPVGSFFLDELPPPNCLPSSASSSSLSGNREIQYELLSLLQGQSEGEGRGEQERQKEINRPEREEKIKKMGGGKDKIYIHSL